VKEKISKEKGWEPATQKLIYSGMLYTEAQGSPEILGQHMLVCEANAK